MHATPGVPVPHVGMIFHTGPVPVAMLTLHEPDQLQSRLQLCGQATDHQEDPLLLLKPFPPFVSKLPTQVAELGADLSIQTPSAEVVGSNRMTQAARAKALFDVTQLACRLNGKRDGQGLRLQITPKVDRDRAGAMGRRDRPSSRLRAECPPAVGVGVRVCVPCRAVSCRVRCMREQVCMRANF